MYWIHPRARSPRRPVPLLTILALSATTLLAGCGASSTVTVDAGATATAQASATEAEQPPVTMAFTSITQQGTVAAHNPRLAVTATVTNHTDKSIHLVEPACIGPLLKIYLSDHAGHGWDNLFYIECIRAEGATTEDRQMVAAHATGTVTTLCDLTQRAPTPLPEGVAYTVIAEMLWRYTGGEQSTFQAGTETPKEVILQAPANVTLK